jgi:membrane-bound lytic murein transglycosylase A
MKIIKYLPLLVLVLSCATRPHVTKPKDAMRLANANTVEILDTYPIETLIQGIKENIEFFKEVILKQDKEHILVFGDQEVLAIDYINELEKLYDFLKVNKDKEKLYSYLNSNFTMYEVYGREYWGDVFITGYYDPIIEGRLRPTKKYSQALYKTPKDMVVVDFDKYAETFEKFKYVKDVFSEQKSSISVLRGRLILNGDNKEVVPYYSREEIDVHGKLKGKKLEICYVDPIDSFFLQIQGSGYINLLRGRKLKVGYAAQNGHPYYPIGKSLLDVIPVEKMTLRSLRNYLRTLPKNELNEILSQNSSYVFFQKLEGRSLSYLGSELIPGRTIATDKDLLPKGALALLDVEEPVFNSKDDIHAVSWERKPRLVFDQDTGGAIRGAGRVDLYFGIGDKAEQGSGVMRNRGKLYYFVPNSLIKRMED